MAGSREVAGGVLLREAGFVLHALAAPCPIPGWLVLTSERHVRGVYSLSSEEAATLGALAVEVMRAQLAALGAEHVYQFALGDQVHHCHVHLVPRYADTPPHRRGTRCFDPAAADALSSEILARAAKAVSAALRTAPGRGDATE